MATAKELKELSLEDLNRRAAELREGIFKETVKLKTGNPEGPGARRKQRKDLARVLTVVTQKQAKKA
jgi:large subunit ribosomal protein L29